jgi:biofilm PGA synthesis N-glycosyltransferase PgaC
VRIVAIVPFLDEERYLDDFLASMKRQTRPPDHLYLVDDGSSDGSPEIASRFAAAQRHVTFLRRPARRAGSDRLASASELTAFLETLRESVCEPWDVAAKLDADLQLVPELFETIEREFETDPTLGMAGSYLSEVGPRGRRRVHIRPEHVHGATKFYRHECLDDISPIPAIIGWDTIDEATAISRGWETRALSMPSGDPLHLRRRGSQDGLLRAHRRWGMGAWASGHSALLVSLYCIQLSLHHPYLAGGLNYAAGYLSGALKRIPRADPEVRAFTRRTQRRRVVRRLVGRNRGPR